MQKINFNKSIKDKEKKILEYYKKKNNQEKTIPEKTIPEKTQIRKRTKKNIQKTHTINTTDENKNKNETEKLTKTAKLPIPESTKPKVVDMD